MEKERAMSECSRWRRFLAAVGLPVPATKSSEIIKTVVTKMMVMGSRYFSLGAGNHGRDMKFLGWREWCLMELKRCHIPITKNANPSDTWPDVPPCIFMCWWF